MYWRLKELIGTTTIVGGSFSLDNLVYSVWFFVSHHTFDSSCNPHENTFQSHWNPMGIPLNRFKPYVTMLNHSSEIIFQSIDQNINLNSSDSENPSVHVPCRSSMVWPSSHLCPHRRSPRRPRRSWRRGGRTSAAPSRHLVAGWTWRGGLESWAKVDGMMQKSRN